MSRTAAKKRFSLEDHAKATAGIEWGKDEAVIDETPMAYKAIDAVMAAKAELVDVVFTLQPGRLREGLTAPEWRPGASGASPIAPGRRPRGVSELSAREIRAIRRR